MNKTPEIHVHASTETFLCALPLDFDPLIIPARHTEVLHFETEPDKQHIRCAGIGRMNAASADEAPVCVADSVNTAFAEQFHAHTLTFKFPASRETEPLVAVVAERLARDWFDYNLMRMNSVPTGVTLMTDNTLVVDVRVLSLEEPSHEDERTPETDALLERWRVTRMYRSAEDIIDDVLAEFKMNQNIK